ARLAEKPVDLWIKIARGAGDSGIVRPAERIGSERRLELAIGNVYGGEHSGRRDFVSPVGWALEYFQFCAGKLTILWHAPPHLSLLGQGACKTLRRCVWVPRKRSLRSPQLLVQVVLFDVRKQRHKDTDPRPAILRLIR